MENSKYAESFFTISEVLIAVKINEQFKGLIKNEEDAHMFLRAIEDKLAESMMECGWDLIREELENLHDEKVPDLEYAWGNEQETQEI